MGQHVDQRSAKALRLMGHAQDMLTEAVSVLCEDLALREHHDAVSSLVRAVEGQRRQLNAFQARTPRQMVRPR